MTPDTQRTLACRAMVFIRAPKVQNHSCDLPEGHTGIHMCDHDEYRVPFTLEVLEAMPK